MKPILFNTEMVRAILDGRKTVTRRAVKPKSKNAMGFYVTFRKSDGAFMGVYDYDENESMFENSQTPTYQVGDILYVQESFCLLGYNEGQPHYGHKAENEQNTRYKWKSASNMPKEAARIFLRVTDVWVERLRNMNFNDFLSEGIPATYGLKTAIELVRVHADKFKAIWNSTIKKADLDIYGWDANPWVWVYAFERCKKDGGSNA